MDKAMPIINTVKTIFPEPFWAHVWLAGGTVRDMLRGEAGQDLDLIVNLTPEQLRPLGFRPVHPVSSRPIWFQHLQKTGKVELTTITTPGMLTADLQQRDFTINALAMTLDGVLIDPLQGTAAIEARQLHVCSPDAFSSDPIRIFRALRFAAGGWQMTPATTSLIRQQHWEPLLNSIPVERFSKEMLKALAHPDPHQFFMGMLELQVGSSFLPELFRMHAIPAGPLDKHPEGDLLTHSLQVMQRVADQTTDPLARFCALFHDLGKLVTDPQLYPKHHGHDKAGSTLAPSFCKRLRLPAAWHKALSGVCRLHTNANNWHDLRDATKIRMAEEAIRAGISKILALISEADKPGMGSMLGWNTVLQIAQMGTTELGIEQERMAAMAPAERSGYLLQKRIEALRHDGCTN